MTEKVAKIDAAFAVQGIGMLPARPIVSQSRGARGLAIVFHVGDGGWSSTRHTVAYPPGSCFVSVFADMHFYIPTRSKMELGGGWPLELICGSIFPCMGKTSVNLRNSSGFQGGLAIKVRCPCKSSQAGDFCLLSETHETQQHLQLQNSKQGKR